MRDPRWSVHFADEIDDERETLCGLPLKDDKLSVTSAFDASVTCEACAEKYRARTNLMCVCGHTYENHSRYGADGVVEFVDRLPCDSASCKCMDFDRTDDTQGAVGTVKPTNPKDAVGIKKAPLSTVPMPVVFELGLAMLEGALKYGRHNYRVSGVRASVYFDAAMRHLAAWWEGEDFDPEVKGAKVSHLVKAMACLAVVRDAQRLGKLVDDRPPSHDEGWVAELNEEAALMLERYPEPKPPAVKLPDDVEASDEAQAQREGTLE